MHKVIIIDDEPLARSIVKEFLSEIKDVQVVAECDNGFQGLKAINEHHPDLVFLDIQMPKISGFEMLELLDEPPPVIFTTAFDEFAIKAFESNSIDYLLKPFSQERFMAAIQKWSSRQLTTQDAKSMKAVSNSHKQVEEQYRVVVKNGSDIQIIPVNEIVYLEAYDDYVKIFTAKNHFLKKKTMHFYEEVLDASKFLRTHRSYIINLDQLTKIEPLEKNTYVAILKGGHKIPVSRSGYLKLKEKLAI